MCIRDRLGIMQITKEEPIPYSAMQYAKDFNYEKGSLLSDDAHKTAGVIGSQLPYFVWSGSLSFIGAAGSVSATAANKLSNYVISSAMGLSKAGNLYNQSIRCLLYTSRCV